MRQGGILSFVARVYLSLGSNLGDRWRHLQEGVQLLPHHGIVPVQISSVYETAPVGETPDPRPYLNVGLWAETPLEPLALLEAVKHIERQMGRPPDTGRWLPRTLDIDIILYENLRLETPKLTLPHPRMQTRAFVLIPLAELTPDLILPDGTPLQTLLQNPILKQQEVKRYDAQLSLPSS